LFAGRPIVKEEREVDDDPSAGRDPLSSLDTQFKLLKKDLKMKEDKLSRLTEHCTMLANQLDRYKGEVWYCCVLNAHRLFCLIRLLIEIRLRD
jgi:hypothetical protein